MMDTGKMYFIVDAAGNYYKLDRKDHLVTAKSSDEASLFTIRDANERIGSGKKAKFYSVLEADLDLSYDEDVLVEQEPEIKEESHETLETPTMFDELHNNWESLLTNLCYMSDHMGDYQKNLSQMLSDVDKEISDILHYIELNELDDQGMLKASRMLQERRRHRREIKDEMDKTALMKSTFLDGSFGIKVQQSLEVMEKMKQRQYTPRKLSELFEQQRLSA